MRDAIEPWPEINLITAGHVPSRTQRGNVTLFNAAGFGGLTGLMVRSVFACVASLQVRGLVRFP